MRSELRIGVASRTITPDLGCPLAGFDARQGVAERIHDDLWARALVIDDGDTTVALVSVEVLGVSRVFSDQVRQVIEQRTGIPARNVIISATHTHCAPVTLNHFFNQGQALDGAYLDRLAAGIVASAVSAFESRAERRLRTGLVPVDSVAVNRRTESGLPVDPTAGVMCVEEPDGTIRSIAVFYACHTTTLGPDTLDVTADFPFYTGRRLRARFGESAEVLYFNGAEGDLSVGHRSDLSAVGIIAPNRTFERAEELGTRLADCVAAGLSTLDPESGPVVAGDAVARLPLKSYGSLPEMRARRERDGIAMLQAVDGGRPQPEIILAKQRSLFSRIEEYYASLLEDSSEPGRLAVELTGIRIGSTAFLSFPGEVFVEIALAIRAGAPVAKTFFLGLANDYIGYVPTSEANASLGYEVVASRVTPEAASVLTEAALALLGQISEVPARVGQ